MTQSATVALPLPQAIGHAIILNTFITPQLEANFVLDTENMNVSIGAMFGIIPITVRIRKCYVSGE
jgi:hypothetical protein